MSRMLTNYLHRSVIRYVRSHHWPDPTNTRERRNLIVNAAFYTILVQQHSACKVLRHNFKKCAPSFVVAHHTLRPRAHPYLDLLLMRSAPTPTGSFYLLHTLMCPNSAWGSSTERELDCSNKSPAVRIWSEQTFTCVPLQKVTLLGDKNDSVGEFKTAVKAFFAKMTSSLCLANGRGGLTNATVGRILVLNNVSVKC